MTTTGASTATTGNGAGPPVSVGVVAGVPVGVVVVPDGVVVVPVGMVVGTGNPLDTHDKCKQTTEHMVCTSSTVQNLRSIIMLYIYHGEEVYMVNI